jgi:hypothetical protein
MADAPDSKSGGVAGGAAAKNVSAFGMGLRSRIVASRGTVRYAKQFANHESPKTTKPYDHTSDQITLDEVERIVI